MQVGNNTVTAKGTGLKYTGTYSSITNYYGTITSETASPNNGTEMNYPVFLPETYAYNYINIGDIYNLAKNLGKSGNIYGLDSSSNSHQMKNSEWGAVAYLTQSSYGLNGNIHINNANLNNSIYVNDTDSTTKANIYAITGWVGASSDESSNTVTKTALNDGNQTGVTVWYKQPLGSSTGTIYGIYDLSGCVWERVSAYIENPNGAINRDSYGGTLVTGTTDEHKTVYSYGIDTQPSNYTENRSRYGDAIYETSSNGINASWYSDYSDFMRSTSPFVIRGGNYDSGSSGGVFAFGISDGSAGNSGGFRAVLSPL